MRHDIFHNQAIFWSFEKLSRSNFFGIYKKFSFENENYIG